MTVYTPDTDDRREEIRQETDDRSMDEVSHTNPYTGEAFGDSQVYTRGRIAVVDGGEADAADEDEETIGDIDHTPREDAPSTNEVYERGVEGDEDDDGGEATDAPEEGV